MRLSKAIFISFGCVLHSATGFAASSGGTLSGSVISAKEIAD
jgi:hypothetical protein